MPATISNQQVGRESNGPAQTSSPLGGDSVVPSQTAGFSWPDWARTARISGAYFAPGNDDIAARLDQLAAQHVSVIIADSPLGQQYSAWVDDAEFAAVTAVVATMVQKAHDRGLKVVLYHTGLELLSPPARNPGNEHPEWAQRGLDGTPILFNDVTKEQEHWLNAGIWDLWVSPCADATASSFRHLAFDRIREIVKTGIDGLWVDEAYLQSSVGDHDDLWPSSDPCSAAAFTAATGLPMPSHEDWDDPAFQRWIVWRHTQIADYLLAEKDVARSVNPDIVFLNENSSVDTGRSTYVATDPTAFLPHPDVTTGHEVETIADRMDEGETGMKTASLDDWLAFRTMIAFARGADRGKPSWILTYGYLPRDSAQLAGMVLAEGANFYETKGPQMADTVDSAFRSRLFGWIATHQADLYDGESIAQVGLLYGPRTRDLIDTVSGEPYDVADSVHFAAYRATANLLYRAHIPFDVVIDTDVAVFNKYPILIAPELQLMSDTTAQALSEASGRLVTIGETGAYDEWLTPRDRVAPANKQVLHFADVNPSIAKIANTGLLTTTAPAAVQFGLRYSVRGYSVVVVNTAAKPSPAFTVDLPWHSPAAEASAHMSTLEGVEQSISVALDGDRSTARLSVPAGVDTIALLTLSVEP